jgi:putative endonuclease
MTQPISLAGRKTGKSPDPPVLAERGKKYMHYVYILKCSDGSYYTGYTTDLSRRLKKHNEGRASRYTRGRLLVEYLYWEVASSKSEALKRELEIKKLKRPAKEMLIKNNCKPTINERI